MGTILAIDGGRSRCRVALWGQDGQRLEGSGRGIPALAGPDAVARVLQAVTETATQLPPHAWSGGGIQPEQVDVVAGGFAGLLAGAGHAPAIADGLARYFQASRVVLASDVVTAHAGALDGEGGVVVVAGTGAVALAVDPGTGGWARADGWGPIFGDAGGGHWIARAGLDSALRHFDGRGGSELLAQLAEAHFGPLDELPARILVPNTTARIASFAPEVAVAARQGDPRSVAIWADAARHLAASTTAAASRLWPENIPVVVSWAGTLFEAASDLVADAFEAELGSIMPSAKVLPPAADALAGCLALARGGGFPGSLVYSSP